MVPAAAVVLVAVALWAALGLPSFYLQDIGLSISAAALYVSNLWWAAQAVDYLAPTADPQPLLHFWSLSLEEQFYFAFPILLALGVKGLKGRWRPDRIFVALLAVVFLTSLAADLVVSGVNQPLAFFSPMTRAWQFAAGGLLGVSGLRVRGRTAILVPIAGLGLILFASVTFGELEVYPGAGALVPTAGAALVLLGGAGVGRAPHRAVPARLLAALGTYSYSLYLWHWPVLTAISFDEPAGVPARLGGIGLSLGLAAVTYHWVENPMRRSTWLALRRRTPALGGAAMLLLLPLGVFLEEAARPPSTDEAVVTAARFDVPEMHFEACNVQHEGDAVIPCYFGRPEGPLVVLVGDSHAEQWQPALAEMASENGWRLQVQTKFGCPMVDVTILNSYVGGVYEDCRRWRDNVLEELRRAKPHLVVVANFSGYAYEHEGKTLGAGTDRRRWEAGLSRSLAAISHTAERTVYLRDTPMPRIDIPVCLYENAGEEGKCDFDRESTLSHGAPDAAVARTVPGVNLIDLGEVLCPSSKCLSRFQGVTTFRDDDHMTATFSRLLAQPLNQRLTNVWADAPPATQAADDRPAGRG